MRVRREDRIEDVPDPPVVDHERESLEERHPARLEGGQPERAGELERLVAQHGKGQVKALGHLALVVGRLRAERQHASAEIRELRVRVAERAGLRSASAGAGDLVPPGWQLLVRTAGAGVAEENRATVELVEANGLPGRRCQRDRRNGGTEKMIGRAVVLGDREIRRKRVDVVRASQGNEPTRSARRSRRRGPTAGAAGFVHR